MQHFEDLNSQQEMSFKCLKCRIKLLEVRQSSGFIDEKTFYHEGLSAGGRLV